MNALAAWQNFYVLVGSAAGALIGLQFVVLVLIADMPATEGLAAAGFAAAAGAPEALFGVGAAALLLLFIGIRNAWDNITYHVFVQRPAAHRERRRG